MLAVATFVSIECAIVCLTMYCFDARACPRTLLYDVVSAAACYACIVSHQGATQCAACGAQVARANIQVHKSECPGARGAAPVEPAAAGPPPPPDVGSKQG